MLTPEQVSHRLRIAQKIPFLKDLSADQVNRVIQAGKMMSIDAERRLCKSGEHSNAMWLLLAGELSVRDGEIALATIESIDIVGEMGLITGMPRSASIVVTQDAVLLEIGKLRLEALLKNDIDLERKLYRNMLQSLCSKLRLTTSHLKQNAPKLERELAASLT